MSRILAQGDALVTPDATLTYGPINIVLRPQVDRNAYTIVRAGTIEEIVLVIDEDKLTKEDREWWEPIVIKQQPLEFQVIISDDESQKIGFGGMLPSTEEEDSESWSVPGVGAVGVRVGTTGARIIR